MDRPALTTFGAARLARAVAVNDQTNQPQETTMTTTVVDEEVRYGGPQRVIYSEDRTLRCYWQPHPRPAYASSVTIAWSHDGGATWRSDPRCGVVVYGDEDAHVAAALQYMAQFRPPHPLDRSMRMGRGPAWISWCLDARPGVITVEHADSGAGAPDPARLTAQQAVAAADYLESADPAQGRWGVDVLTLAVHDAAAGSAMWSGCARTRIDRWEWASALRAGAAALAQAGQSTRTRVDVDTAAAQARLQALQALREALGQVDEDEQQ